MTTNPAQGQSPYLITIWYAEHNSEGDKYYKVVNIYNRSADKSFAILNYGPRSTHVSMRNVTTGQGAVDTELTRGTSAGSAKKIAKQSNGYSRNEKSESVELPSYQKLREWLTNNVGRKFREPALKAANLQDFGTVVEFPAEPEVAPVSPSLLNQHADFGSW